MILLRFFPILIMTSVFIYSCEVETQKLSQKDVTFFGTGKVSRYQQFKDGSHEILRPLFFAEIFPIRSTGSFFTTGNATYIFLLLSFWSVFALRNNFSDESLFLFLFINSIIINIKSFKNKNKKVISVFNRTN